MLATSPAPPPFPKERTGTVCACTKIFYGKKFVHFVICMWKIILTKKSFLWTRLQWRFTCRTLLRYTFQTWEYHFSKRTVQQRDNKLVYQSGAFREATEILTSLRTLFVVAPPWTRSAFYNRNGARYSLTKQWIWQSISPLFAWNEHVRFTFTNVR